MRFYQLAACAVAITTPLCAEIGFHTSAPALSHVAPPQLFPAQQVRRSGMIFSGSVVSIAHVSAPGALGITEITFKVESAMRGMRRGQILRVR